MFDPLQESVWHTDGHRIYLQLHRNELSVQITTCPGDDERDCKIGKFDCIVQWFLDTYGLDCNVGLSEVASDMEIAWMVQGDTDDPDLCQVWIIPTADEMFSAWLMTQQAVEEDSIEDVSHQDEINPSDD
jgi:hypothetical protein